MIVGIGIDSVEIARFSEWSNWPEKKLGRIFSPHEIAYCLSNKVLSSQRFAARFAAREAFYKALTQYQPDVCIPFLSLCKLVEVRSDMSRAPQLEINWCAINIQISNVISHISITHTSQKATAIVMLER